MRRKKTPLSIPQSGSKITSPRAQRGQTPSPPGDYVAARALAAQHGLWIKTSLINGDRDRPDTLHVSIRLGQYPILDWIPSSGKAWRGGMSGSDHALVHKDGLVACLTSIQDAVEEAIACL